MNKNETPRNSIQDDARRRPHHGPMAREPLMQDELDQAAKIPALMERFWEKVQKTSECWNWVRARRGNGYGQFNFFGACVAAHRFSWQMANGPIPAGLQVMHKCDNRRCVRPDHLQVGTAKDNTQDMIAKGRHFIGRGMDALRAENAALREEVRQLRGQLKIKRTQVNRLRMVVP